MNYFAVLGKHSKISLEEIAMIYPSNIQRKGSIITFQTSQPELLSNLWGFLKWGRVIDEEQAQKECSDLPIIGTSTTELGMTAKKKRWCKRFKLTDPDQTDLEVKNQWKELLEIGIDQYGIVDGYQNITLYEAIDFNKPMNGMEIGMMPAKLTHILINIAISQTSEKEKITIRDPFTGFGTTNMVANALGYATIGSDINIIQAKKNLTRRKTQSFAKDLPVTLFKHDVHEPFTKPFLKHTTHIVSEGWLGPVIRGFFSDKQAEINQHNIFKIYQDFFTHIHQYFDHITGVITLPHYVEKDNILIGLIEKHLTQLKMSFHFISELYVRPRQKVARQILIFKK